VTRVADTHVPDEIYERVAAQFNEAELVALTFAVVVIDSRNRLSVSSDLRSAATSQGRRWEAGHRFHNRAGPVREQPTGAQAELPGHG
jgi:hypothetical protein